MSPRYAGQDSYVRRQEGKRRAKLDANESALMTASFDTAMFVHLLNVRRSGGRFIWYPSQTIANARAKEIEKELRA
jgi:hypothetical protein